MAAVAHVWRVSFVGRMEIRGTPWALNCTKCDIVKSNVRSLWNPRVKNLLAILEADARTTCAYVSNDHQRNLHTHSVTSLVLSVFFLSPGICQHAVLPSEKCPLPACRWSIRSTTEGWGFLIEIGNVNRRLEYSGSTSHLLFVSRSRCAGTLLARYDFTRAFCSWIAFKYLVSIDNIQLSLSNTRPYRIRLKSCFRDSSFYWPIYYLGLEPDSYCPTVTIMAWRSFRILKSTRATACGNHRWVRWNSSIARHSRHIRFCYSALYVLSPSCRVQGSPSEILSVCKWLSIAIGNCVSPTSHFVFLRLVPCFYMQ